MKQLEWSGTEMVERPDREERVLSIPHDQDILSDTPDLTGVDVVELSFPVLRDGRAFTQARALRRAGFDGDIRATGALFTDQIRHAIRCGFTSFDLSDGHEAVLITKQVTRYPSQYQRSAVGALKWEVSS